MLVNYLFNIQVDHNEIEVYNLIITLCLAIYSTFITSSSTSDIQTFCSIFYVYLIFDTLFIPGGRLDRYLHHLLSFVLVTYAKAERLNQTSSKIHELITFPFIQTEVSTIFLTSSFLLKKFLPTHTILLNLSNTMLFYTFLQYRILNLSYVVYHLLFHNDLDQIEYNDLYIIRSVSTLLLLLNYFWEYKICLFFYRHYDIISLIHMFLNTIRKRSFGD